jgi:CheY-like chemotaxis protein
MTAATVPTLRLEPSKAPRVLLVDDDALLLSLFREVLSLKGHTVVAAANGSKAELSAAREPAFDLLITDYNMPELNGVELALRLTLRQPDLPVLLISGEQLDHFSTELVRTRAWRFLSKPVGCGNLISAVDQLVLRSTSHIPGVQRAHPSRPPPAA